jgi:predicted anti-sigma-YlaC factor YlaD
VRSSGLSCDEVARLFQGLLEEGLKGWQEEVLRAHLDSCPACRAKYALDLALIETIRTAPREAYESVAGEVVRKVRVTERRRWAVRWGAVVAAVCSVALLTVQFAPGIRQALLGLLTGGFKTSPTYLALSKVAGVVVDLAAGLKPMIFGGTLPGGISSYGPQMAMLILATGAIVLLMMYGMGIWLGKPREVRSWRRG